MELAMPHTTKCYKFESPLINWTKTISWKVACWCSCGGTSALTDINSLKFSCRQSGDRHDAGCRPSVVQITHKNLPLMAFLLCQIYLWLIRLWAIKPQTVNVHLFMTYIHPWHQVYVFLQALKAEDIAELVINQLSLPQRVQVQDILVRSLYAPT